MNIIEIYSSQYEENSKPWEELEPLFEAERERLDEILLSYLPELHRRLKLSHWAELKQWIETNDFSAAHFEVEDPEDLIRSICWSIEDKLYLALDGYDGIYPFRPITEEIQKRIRELTGLILEQKPREMVNRIIYEVLISKEKGRFNTQEAKDDAAFFIFGILESQKASDELQMLWILESSSKRHAYLFMIEDDVTIHPIWGICRDILPTEIIEVLDNEFWK